MACSRGTEGHCRKGSDLVKGSSSCVSSAKNLKNVKFFKRKDFQRACAYPVKPKPAVRLAILESLGLISFFFFLSTGLCAVREACPVIKHCAQLTSAPAIPHLELPGLLPKRPTEAAGMEGPQTAAEMPVADPQEIKNPEVIKSL